MTPGKVYIWLQAPENAYDYDHNDDALGVAPSQ